MTATSLLPATTATASKRDRAFTVADSDAVYKLGAQPTPLGEKVAHALSIIEEALERYGLKHLALSFNGGKDCTVLIHLLAAVVYRSLPSSSSSPPPIPALYIRSAYPFPEVETFVTVCTERYGLNLVPLEMGMKDALSSYVHPVDEVEVVDEKGKGIEAVMVGVRRCDPSGLLLEAFSPTDPGWPPFMRVHPILDWSYQQIWEFLRSEDLTLGDVKVQEWCVLYDYGYTSLGSTHNTFPNPLLKKSDGGWKPAWELEDETQERAGRGTKESVLTGEEQEGATD